MSEAPPDPWYVSAFDDSYLRRYAHRDEAEARRQVTTLAPAAPAGRAFPGALTSAAAGDGTPRS